MAFVIVVYQSSKSKSTKQIHNIKFILCAACMFHAQLLSYLTLNHNIECEEPGCIIYFWLIFFSQTVSAFLFWVVPTSNFLQLASPFTFPIKYLNQQYCLFQEVGYPFSLIVSDVTYFLYNRMQGSFSNFDA